MDVNDLKVIYYNKLWVYMMLKEISYEIKQIEKDDKYNETLCKLEHMAEVISSIYCELIPDNHLRI